MTERVARLRACSLETKPWLSLERAAAADRVLPHAATRRSPCRYCARCRLRYLMERKTIYIGGEELIVGERGPAPKGTPTYPELCCHSMEDLEILHSREKISYAVGDEARRIQATEIIPFWQGRSHARPHLRGDDARVEGRLRGRHLHRVHGAARARPHRAGRRDLPQGPAGPAGGDRRRAGAPGFLQRPAGVRQAAGAEGHADCGRRGDPLRRAARRAGASAWRAEEPEPRAKRNWRRSPRSAAACRRTRRAISRKRCRLTGSSTWA